MFGIDLCSKCNEPEEGGCGLGGWRHDDDAAAAVKNAVLDSNCHGYLQLQVQRQTSSVEQIVHCDCCAMTTHLFLLYVLDLSGVGRKCHRVLDSRRGGARADTRAGFVAFELG